LAPPLLLLLLQVSLLLLLPLLLPALLLCLSSAAAAACCCCCWQGSNTLQQHGEGFRAVATPANSLLPSLLSGQLQQVQQQPGKLAQCS
jgi:hypothetical protein